MGKKKKKTVSRAEAVSAAKKRRGKKPERRKVVQAQSQGKHEQSGRATGDEGKLEESGRATGAACYSVEDYMCKVEEYMDSFQIDMAVKFCERALQMEPNNLHVLETIAPLLLEAGEPDRAYDLFQHAVSLNPDEGHTKYMYLGQLTHGQEAIGYFTKGIEIMTSEGGVACEGGEESMGGACGGEDYNKQLSGAYCALAEVYLTDTCFESDAGQRCYECCSKAVGLLPGNPEAHQLMASCLLSQQLPDKAREALMKGLSLWLPGCSEKQEQKEEGKEEEEEEEKTEQLYSKLGCDEEAILTHATEILAELEGGESGHTASNMGEREGSDEDVCMDMDVN